MGEAIVDQLKSLYGELANRKSFSEVARVDLSTADAWGRVERLLIFQCGSEDLGLTSFVPRWWIVDASGVHGEEDWPLSDEIIREEGWEARLPHIRFATDGQRVRFGMRFGHDWYVVREGPLGPDGKFVPDQLIHPYASADQSDPDLPSSLK